MVTIASGSLSGPASSGRARPEFAGRTARRFLLAVAIAWVTVAVLHETNLGGQWYSVDTATWAWLALWLGAFSLGGIMGIASTRATRPPPAKTDRQIDIAILALSLTSVVGAALFIFDFAILRGYGFATAAAAIRQDEVNEAVTGAASLSVISGMGRMMIPASAVLVGLLVLLWDRVRRTAKFVSILAIIFVLYEQLVFEGGRLFITSAVLVGIFAYIVSQRGRGAISIVRSLPIVRLTLLGSLLLSFFGYVFVTRVLERGDYFSSAYLLLTSSFRITPNYGQMGWFEGPLGGLWFVICMIWLYATQGFTELDLILSTRYLEHARGLYDFPQIGQIVFALTGIDIRYDALANLPTYGSYATIYGHTYVDFGNMGSILFGGAIGFLACRGVVLLARGHVSPSALLSFLLVPVALFSPVISMFPSIWPIALWTTAIVILFRSTRLVSGGAAQ